MEENATATKRDTFLVAMYAQMWGNINRHILVVWQSIAALLGAFAVFSLTEKRVISTDIACALIILICVWVKAHVIDANAWFNRNLLIITNIERQFLTSADAQLIQFYFAQRHKPRDLDHLTIQAWFANSVFALILTWHFFTRVVPGFAAQWEAFDFFRALPYAITLLALRALRKFQKKQNSSFANLSQKSPGTTIATWDPASDA